MLSLLQETLFQFLNELTARCNHLSAVMDEEAVRLHQFGHGEHTFMNVLGHLGGDLADSLERDPESPGDGDIQLQEEPEGAGGRPGCRAVHGG